MTKTNLLSFFWDTVGHTNSDGYKHGCSHHIAPRARTLPRQRNTFFAAQPSEVCHLLCQSLSVCLSVRLSVKRVYCEKTKAPSEKKFNYD